MNSHQDNSSQASQCSTTILHSVNLTFDRRTSNIGVKPDVPAKNSVKEKNDPQVCDKVKKREPRKLRDDINGTSQDNFHGNTHNGCIGYSSSQGPLLGNSQENSSAVDHFFGIQDN